MSTPDWAAERSANNPHFDTDLALQNADADAGADLAALAILPDERWVKPIGTEADWPADLAEQHRTYQRRRAVGPLIAAARRLSTVTAATLPEPVENPFVDEAKQPRWAGSRVPQQQMVQAAGEAYTVPKPGNAGPAQLGVRDHMDHAPTDGMLIPLWSLTGNRPGRRDLAQFQLRLDVPRTVKVTTTDKKTGKTVDGGERELKFEVPLNARRGSEEGCLPADVHPLANEEAPVKVFTEGQAKGDAILTAAFREGLNVCPVTFTGVDMPLIGQDRPEGDRWHKALTAAVTDLFNLGGETVYLCWDADWRTNRNVRRALVAVGDALAAEGARVFVIDVPEVNDDPKTGVDDYLAYCREHQGRPRRGKAVEPFPLSALLVNAITLEEAEIIAGDYEAVDSARAERLADEMVRQGTWRFNAGRADKTPAQGYMHFIGGVWKSDPAGVKQLAIKVANWAGADDPGARSKSGLNAAIDLASSDPRLIISEEDLDADPFILNCLNGIVDLRTGQLSPHDPAKLCSLQAAVNYDPRLLVEPDFGAPLFMRFLAQTFKAPRRVVRPAVPSKPTDEEKAAKAEAYRVAEYKRAEMIRWQQRKFGEALIGKTMSDGMVQTWGTGRNGKSVLYMLVAMPMLGTYGQVLPPEMLTGKGASHDQLALLAGKRFVVMSETNKGDRLHTSTFKLVAGKEAFEARRLYESWFTVQPRHLLTLMTNHRLAIDDDGFGTWRRMSLVPFLNTVADEDTDEELPERLLAEAPGILAWMVRGAMEFVAYGYSIPACTVVKAATETYQAGEDTLAQFVSDKLVFGERARMVKSEVYRQYRMWAAEQGITKVPTAKDLWASLNARSLLNGVRDVKLHGIQTLIGVTSVGDINRQERIARASGGVVTVQLPEVEEVRDRFRIETAVLEASVPDGAFGDNPTKADLEVTRLCQAAAKVETEKALRRARWEAKRANDIRALQAARAAGVQKAERLRLVA